MASCCSSEQCTSNDRMRGYVVTENAYLAMASTTSLSGKRVVLRISPRFKKGIVQCVTMVYNGCARGAIPAI
jgi:hypothetical protein